MRFEAGLGHWGKKGGGREKRSRPNLGAGASNRNRGAKGLREPRKRRVLNFRTDEGVKKTVLASIRASGSVNTEQRGRRNILKFQKSLGKKRVFSKRTGRGSHDLPFRRMEKVERRLQIRAMGGPDRARVVRARD